MMIQLRCHNIETGGYDVIHEWPGGAPFKTAEEFLECMIQQDKSTDHYYDLAVVDEGD